MKQIKTPARAKQDRGIRKEIVRSMLAAIFVWATDFGVYFCLIHLLPFSLAKAVSYISAGIVAYLFNKNWIFRYSETLSFREVGRYVFINCLTLGLNVGVNQAVLRAWPGAVLSALIMAAALSGAVTFISYKWWVFRVVLPGAAHFAWWRWLPWRSLITEAARKQGFLDPMKVLSELQRFAQPSEVAAPLELLRSGVVMHARGLMNSLAIQHNLDWIWPYWVECQYDPENVAFIPRSFSLTQINLTHRNWTALGVPDGIEFPLVDPRGLLTPLYDGWSIDVWIIPEEGVPLVLPRNSNTSQGLVLDHDLVVITEGILDQMRLELKARVVGSPLTPCCQLGISAYSSLNAQLVVSLRPYNPEGVSLVHHVRLLEGASGWEVNGENLVYVDKPPDRWLFSDYNRGDVYSRLSSTDKETSISCKVGMVTAAAVYRMQSAQVHEITVMIPLTDDEVEKQSGAKAGRSAASAWEKTLQGVCALQIPDKHFQFLYEAALYTMILHSPREVYPGPYIYRRFWFRDAAFILNAMLCVGLKQRVKRALDCFRARQTVQGYFLSQEGEWDSNGEALWVMRQYCEMTGNAPPPEWRSSIGKAGQWISRKRNKNNVDTAHAGLLPSGFSAEHLGPNDFYYWDDFWGVAGLRAAAFLCAAYQDHDKVTRFESEADALQQSIDRSLGMAAERLKRVAMPASPYRRLDSGAIGSLAADYPLHLLAPGDPRVLDTVNFLMKNCLLQGGFFHDMTHSGINPYLTLHLAQVLLRAGDSRYLGLMTAVADIATSTGQWPESVHPATGGGCMGDGQHVWAAAEWVLMIRNCFVREEDERLILCCGIPPAWLDKKKTISFGPAPTRFGEIQISITPGERHVLIKWNAHWFSREPLVDIQLPGFASVRTVPGSSFVELKNEADGKELL